MFQNKNLVIIDQNTPQAAVKTLQSFGVISILSAKVPNIITGVCTHPDMQIHPVNPQTIICAPSVYAYYKKALNPYNVEVIMGETAIESTYPNDIAYNIARIGNIVIGNIPYCDKKILRYYQNAGYRIVPVKQGYTKCNLCIVRNDAAITSDPGISTALTDCGVDVLQINAGEILLDGTEYGFIGGTCGLIGPKTMAFCGDITKHSSYESIKEFLKKHGVDIIILCEQKLQDIGSIIPIKPV